MILIAGSILTVGSAGMAAEAPVSRVVVEGGLVRPLEELGADFDRLTLGLGAGDGYEVGFRFRLPLTSTQSISPGFHFVDFERHVITDAADKEFQTEALSYRFTLEWMYSPNFSRGGVRPFVAAAGGLYRNRVVGFYDDPVGEKLDHSANSLGYSLRAGLAFGSFEASLVAHRNEVDTWRFHQTDAEENYRWHQVGARFGYLLPW